MDEIPNGVFSVKTKDGAYPVRYAIIPNQEGPSMFFAAWDEVFTSAFVMTMKEKVFFPHLSGCIDEGAIVSFSVPKGPCDFFAEGAEMILQGIAKQQGLGLSADVLTAAKNEQLWVTDRETYNLIRDARQENDLTSEIS